MNASFDLTKIKWLQLIRTPGIGPVKFWNLLKKYEEIERAIETINDPYPFAKAEAEWAEHQKCGCHLIAAFEETYPNNLKHLNDYPPLISVRGEINALSKPSLAIVGARNASLSGRKLSFQFAKELGENGWVIVSGLARGIDEAAHKGSLNTGTIAVLAGGVDHIYPPEHESLYNDILQTGAIISEMPLGTSPSAALFPRRNRLIAALSQGVVIVEAARKSGSLITADYALELGIDVFAVPGSPLDPRCQGSNFLLKQGATFIESASDILDVVGVLDRTQQECTNVTSTDYKPTHSNALSDIKKQILEDLTSVPTSIEILMNHYNYPASEFMSLLAELELEGLILRHPGNGVSLVI